MANTIEVECPNCNKIIEIDLDTKKVIAHKEKKSNSTSLEDFMAAQINKSKELEEKFQAGVEKAKNKSNEIDNKFNEFLKNKDKFDSDEPPESNIMWD